MKRVSISVRITGLPEGSIWIAGWEDNYGVEQTRWSPWVSVAKQEFVDITDMGRLHVAVHATGQQDTFGEPYLELQGGEVFTYDVDTRELTTGEPTEKRNLLAIAGLAAVVVIGAIILSRRL